MQKGFQMNYKTLQIEYIDDIVIILLNRPEVLNALNSIMLDEIDEFISNIDFNETKALIITGAGMKAFAAGADISELKAGCLTSATQYLQKGNKLFDKISKLEIPVIALVNGYAFGGGCELALACHFRFATEIAKFGLPEINLGIMPGYGGTVRLSNLIGHSKALEMVLTGKTIDAEEALRIGLVNYIYNQDKIVDATIDFINTIISKPALSIKHILNHYNRIPFLNLTDRFDSEISNFNVLSKTEDFLEGTNAFINKREPIFKGR